MKKNRYTLYIAKKDDIEELSSLSYQEFEDKHIEQVIEKIFDIEYKNIGKIIKGENIGYFYLDENKKDKIESYGKNLFKHKKITEFFSKECPKVYNKKKMEQVIELLKKTFVEEIKDSLITDEEHFKKYNNNLPRESRMEFFLCEMLEVWDKPLFSEKCFTKPLETSGDILTHSKRYECILFELVRLYKEINWDEYEIIIYKIN